VARGADAGVRPAGRPGVAALAGVAGAYYLGALLGAALRFPPATTSVLWPPNAILTAALLLVAPRYFLPVVLAALPAHFAAQLPGGMPLSLSIALFLTNSAQALLAAWLVHAWSDAPARFDTLKRVIVFVGGAVLIAPLAVSAGDAAAVHLIRGEPFGIVFVRRLFSNLLGQLVVVPSAILLVRRLGRPSLREAVPGRAVEVALLAVAHLAIGGVVLLAYHGGFDLPGGPFTALPLLMPLLVVAAIRFGAAGASVSLLSIALLATSIALSRADTTGVELAEDRVLALQTFLIVVGAPLLCLSGLVEERARAAGRLHERLRFEELVAKVSSEFVHVPSDRMREASADALGHLGTFLGLEAAVLSSGTGPLAALADAALPARGQEPVVWTRRALPPETDGHAAWMKRIDPASVLTLSLEAAGQPVGSLVLVPAAGTGSLPGKDAERARVVADVFASALARRRAESEANLLRDELAHCLRVSTVGELAASIAHELNQPLAAILANAQAARRLLASVPRQDHQEIEDILDDIVSEDRRAGDVIRSVRSLLRKGEREPVEVDVNGLVHDVLKLVANDALIREVHIERTLALAGVLVRGDRVQLQQVLLNLLLNALEAMPDGWRERTVRVTTETGPGGMATVSVADTGHGIESGTESAVFEPFYTTKADGLGMGLSIARSIVEAHGGTISAARGAAGGATVRFTLPLASGAD
jgi:signal transduction histidine kinase/integral membrane sensor domain MASE1